MQILELFSTNSTENIRVKIEDRGIHIESSLPENTATYLYSDFASWPQDETFNAVALFADDSSIASGAIIFYDQSNEKLGGSTFRSNQINLLDAPPKTAKFRAAIRVYGSGSLNIQSFNIGTQDDLLRELEQSTSFTYSFGRHVRYTAKQLPLTLTPFVLIETVFCDTETREAVLNRYLSYLLFNIELISHSSHPNWRWHIYISSDKDRYIQAITEFVRHRDLLDYIVIQVFTHPGEGYSNAHETHPDRRFRPNTSFKFRRDFLLDEALKFRSLQYSPMQLIVRLGVDDDDFFAPSHLSVVSNLAEKYFLAHADTDSPEIVLGLTRILVSTFAPDNSVIVEDVEMNRVMTGCRFTIAQGKIPTSPYAITERFDEIKDINHHVARTPHIIATSNHPTFSYNRHGANYSNASKSPYFKVIHSKTKFSSQSDFGNFLLSC